MERVLPPCPTLASGTLTFTEYQCYAADPTTFIQAGDSITFDWQGLHGVYLLSEGAPQSFASAIATQALGPQGCAFTPAASTHRLPHGLHLSAKQSLGNVVFVITDAADT